MISTEQIREINERIVMPVLLGLAFLVVTVTGITHAPDILSSLSFVSAAEASDQISASSTENESDLSVLMTTAKHNIATISGINL